MEREEGARGNTGRKRAAVVGLQTQKERDENGERSKGVQGWEVRVQRQRHCVAQLAGRDEGEKYPEGEIHRGTRRKGRAEGDGRG